MTDPKKLNRLIFILSLIGLAIAGYVLQGYLRNSSVFCPVGGGCETVQKSSYAWPFGIPVPLFGFIGYLLIASLSFIKTAVPGKDRLLLFGLIGISAFGAAFVTWFTLVELIFIKGFCSWCLISAVDMYVLFGLILTSYRQSLKPKTS